MTGGCSGQVDAPRGVLYRCYDAAGRLIYVGSTASYPRRLGEHLRQSWWYGLVCRMKTESHPTLEAARAAESVAIQEEQPTFNTWDTGRPWVARRDHWTKADHALHKSWHRERGIPIPSVKPHIRNGYREREERRARAAARAAGITAA